MSPDTFPIANNHAVREGFLVPVDGKRLLEVVLVVVPREAEVLIVLTLLHFPKDVQWIQTPSVLACDKTVSHPKPEAFNFQLARPNFDNKAG
jgi:hypothetical protein